MKKIEKLITEKNALKISLKTFDGGEGSGNFGHSGRPGKVGGSSSSNISKIDANRAKQFMSDFGISNKDLMSKYSLYPNELADRVNKQIEKGFSIFKSNEDFERAKKRMNDDSLDDKERTKLQKAINRQNLVNSIVEKLSSDTSSETKKEEPKSIKEEKLKKEEFKQSNAIEAIIPSDQQYNSNKNYIDELNKLHLRNTGNIDNDYDDYSYLSKYFPVIHNSPAIGKELIEKAADNYGYGEGDLKSCIKKTFEKEGYGSFVNPMFNLIDYIRDTLHSEDFRNYAERVGNIKDLDEVIDDMKDGKKSGIDVLTHLVLENISRDWNRSQLKRGLTSFLKSDRLQSSLTLYLDKNYKNKFDNYVRSTSRNRMLHDRNMLSLKLPDLNNENINTNPKIEISNDYDTSRKNLKNIFKNYDDQIDKLYGNYKRGEHNLTETEMFDNIENIGESFTLNELPTLLTAMTYAGEVYHDTKTENVHQNGAHNLLNTVVANAPKNKKPLVRYESRSVRYRDYWRLQPGDTIEMDSFHFTASSTFAKKAKSYFGDGGAVRFEIDAGDAPFFDLEHFVWKDDKTGELKKSGQEEGLVAGPMKIVEATREGKDGNIMVFKLKYDWENHQNYINLNNKSYAKMQGEYKN